MTTQLVPGGEFRINTATLGLLQEGVALANGGFVVTWHDNSHGVGGATGDSSGAAVKAQLYDATGAPVGGEILVNTATVGDQTENKVTALANGGFVVTWGDKSHGVGGATGDASGDAVKAQLFSASGARVGSEILVNTAVADNQYQPEITTLANGDFVVTWWTGNGFSNESLDIYGQLFHADGTRVGGEFLVNTATSDAQYEHKMTALPNGGFVVTWRDLSHGIGGATGDSSFSAVKAQVFDAHAARVGGEILVNTTTLLDQDVPEITALSTGGFVVTWRDWSPGSTTFLVSDYDVRAQVFDPAGARVGTEILVNTATHGPQQNQTITALDNGGFVIAWTDQGERPATVGFDSPLVVKAQVFGANGVRVGGEFHVDTTNAGTEGKPGLATLSNGDFVVLWNDGAYPSGDSALRAAAFDPGGNRIGDEVTLSHTLAFDPQPIALSGGAVVAIYHSGLDIYGDLLTLANIPDQPVYLGPPRLAGTVGGSSGSASTPALLTNAAPSAQEANVVAGGNGQVFSILDAHQDFSPVVASVDHGWVLPH